MIGDSWLVDALDTTSLQARWYSFLLLVLWTESVGKLSINIIYGIGPLGLPALRVFASSVKLSFTTTSTMAHIPH